MVLRIALIGCAVTLGTLGCGDWSFPDSPGAEGVANAFVTRVGFQGPSAPSSGFPPLAPVAATLKLGQPAMLYDISEESVRVSVWKHADRGKAIEDRIHPAVGTKVRFLGRVRPGVGENDPEPETQVARARVLVLWGEYAGQIGFVNLSSLRELPHQ